jgi:serine/threonine-protein kinase
LLAFVAAGLSWLARGSPTEARSTVARFTIDLPDTIPLAFIGSASLGNGRRALAISRDGKMLVYAGEQDGVNRLFIRTFDSYEIRSLPGTEGAYNPFFSPDGRWVGFFSGNEVKKMAIDGEDAVLLATVINPMGAAWGSDDRILVGGEGGDLRSISADGGSLEVVRGAERGPYLYPSILPGGDGVVVSDTRSLRLGARVVDLTTDQDHGLRTFAPGARYVASGHLMWSQWSTLFAAPFDLDGWRISGQGVPVVSRVRSEVYGVSQWDVSDTGTLVYASGPAVAEGRLTWVGRGEAEKLPFQDIPHGTFQLSPDEKRIAIVVKGQSDDIWIYDTETARRERLTSGGIHDEPIWSPDGARVAFTKSENGDVVTYVMTVDAGTEAQRLFPTGGS